MKRIPELILLIGIASGVVFLLYEKTDSAIKIVSIALLVASLLGSIVVFFIDQERKTRT
jgi:sorbitol-specific phosphotransferase system component IIC